MMVLNCVSFLDMEYGCLFYFIMENPPPGFAINWTMDIYPNSLNYQIIKLKMSQHLTAIALN